MHNSFPTNYSEIIERLESISPTTYSRTRNYLSGAVTRLSPYLTHGVLTTQDVGRMALARSTPQEAETLLRELAWRDYYQASWSSVGDAIFSDLRYPQPLATHKEMPIAVVLANTGIDAIDAAIRGLYETGYIHNHARMWIAMLCCSIARTAWWNPSRWMYYHLLDGDIASNTLSWQWVAGSSRKEPYVANQENINTYSGTTQRDTYLDVPYEALLKELPPVLSKRKEITLTTELPSTTIPNLSGEVLLYSHWGLTPMWHQNSSLPRILLLEPNHFEKFPISQKRLDFIIGLAANIQGIQVVVANFSQLQQQNPEATFTFIDHPALRHWYGKREPKGALYHVTRPIEKSWSFSKFWHQASITLSESELYAYANQRD